MRRSNTGHLVTTKATNSVLIVNVSAPTHPTVEGTMDIARSIARSGDGQGPIAGPNVPDPLKVHLDPNRKRFVEGFEARPQQYAGYLVGFEPNFAAMNVIQS